MIKSENGKVTMTGHPVTIATDIEISIMALKNYLVNDLNFTSENAHKFLLDMFSFSVDSNI